MISKKNALVLSIAASALITSQPYAADKVTVDADVLNQLQQLIKDQQKQLNQLQKQVNELQQPALTSQPLPDTQVQPQQSIIIAKEVKSTVAAPDNKVVTSGSPDIKLSISGQIHRAMNIADDGDRTDTYFVDSDASNSRIRFLGSADIDDDFSLGSRLEIAVAPNESSTVSQNDEESGDFFDQRYAEVTLHSKTYGKIYFGKGETSSDNSAEVDLSGTDIVQYSSFADIAAGLLFRKSGDDELTNISVSDAFTNFDGLGRKSRLRYDLPTFYGFGLAGSVISDRRWDTSLSWSGSGYGFKAGAAGAIAYIRADNADYQYDGSFSLLHEDTGLNFTFSAGTKDANQGDNPYSLWGKVGWKADLFSFGPTNFGIDYGHSENISADGDEGDSFGIAVVETFTNYSTDVYLQFRQYSLDRDALYADVEDINVGSIGTRVKF